MSVVVVGSINADLNLVVPRIPGPGETLLGSGGQFLPGGKGANQALAARLAGADVVMVGAVGDDHLSSAALPLLQGAGVDLSHVREVPGPSGLAVVSVDDAGENSIVVIAGANAAVDADFVAADAETIGAAEVVVLQGEIPRNGIETAAGLCTGRLVVNLAPVIEVDQAVLLAADPLVVNEPEGVLIARQLGLSVPEDDPEQIVRALADAGVRSVVMTLGSQGAIVLESGELRRVASPTVRAVDTVGAGDAVVGALAAKLADGQTLSAAMTYAVRFAAYTVQHRGAQASYPAPGTELPE